MLPSVCIEVLEHVERAFEPLDEKSMPKALKARWPTPLRSRCRRGRKQHARADPDRRQPPERVAHRDGPRCPCSEHAGSTRSLFAALKEHATRESLDEFAWGLFEAWLTEGAPPKSKWALGSIGFLGSDAAALKLTPLVRAWPGESKHQRATRAWNASARSARTPPSCLNGIAQKLKFKGLKTRRKELMEAIAKDKGLTRAELEDRIVPDCDLDERGTRIFDFGPRSSASRSGRT